MPAQSLAEFAAMFDRASIKSVLTESDQLRAQITTAFPLSTFGELPLERYALRDKDRTTLCYLLEFGSQALGSMKGGSADKLGIYFHAKSAQWKSAIPGIEDPLLAWQALRADFVKAIEYGKAGEWEKIDSLPTARYTPAVRTKWLHVHFPDEVINIYSLAHLTYWIEQLGGSFKQGEGRYTATANRQLVTLLRGISELAGWNLREIGHMLYLWNPPPKKKDKQEENAESESDTTNGTRPPIFHPATLNQILYGPPGTGKTYSAVREAARIINGQPLDDREAKRLFDTLVQQGRVRLATFHQSFSYEDFIEGIRPVMDESGAARFEVRDGVFKEVATEALFACLEAVGTPGDSGFEAYWSALLAKIADAGELEIPGLKDATWIMSETEKGNLRAVNKESQKELTCGRSAMAKVWQVLRPKERASSMDVAMALGRGAHFGVIAAVYNYMQGLKPQVDAPIQSDLPLPNSSSPGTNKGAITESFLELGPASGWQLRADRIFPPYVLIIDEINRGNISRIFGELITLIEDDKRHGEENALMVTLPNSREPFTVPPNLYLVGTMNTADKSLALLDVALRRRFDFRELAPDFALCPTLPAAMQAVLMRLNDRLELRKDRDHRIGHAFFMAVADQAAFNAVFCRKVVPLLQEYFFNDADGARYVLGEESRQDAAGFLRPLIGDSKWQRNRWRWFTDVDPDMDCWARLQVTLGTAEG